jgi:hypothetical protein
MMADVDVQCQFSRLIGVFVPYGPCRLWPSPYKVQL